MKINKNKVLICMARKEMNQIRLAEKCGICKQTISKILSRGSTGPDMVGAIAKALEVDVTEIIDL
jgi:transcriptional regulator with XRE-family HTH domain